IDVVRLDHALRLRGGPPAMRLPVVVLRGGGRPFGVVVDELLGKEEIVIKSLGAFETAAGGSGRDDGAGVAGSSPSSSLMRDMTVSSEKSPVTVISTPASVAASAIGRSRPASSRNGVSFVAGSRRTIVNSS